MMAHGNDESSEAQNGGDDSLGESEELFMTAVDVDREEGGESDEGFFEDIGYNDFAAGFDGGPDDDDELAELRSTADRCRELRRVVDELKSELARKQEENAAASRRDAAKQKESDQRMNRIRQMEEDAKRIHNSIPVQEDQVRRLEAENEETKQRIAEGPGWTESQEKEKTSLTHAIDRSRAEAKEKNDRLADLRAQLKLMEEEVGRAIKRRDESLSIIDSLSAKIDDSRGHVLAAEQEINEAERSKGVLVESLRVANGDLADLKAECSREKEMADRSEEEIEGVLRSQQECSQECLEQAKREANASEEAKRLHAENETIQSGNSHKQKALRVLSDERGALLKERAKMKKLREIIDQKSLAIEKERGLLQKEADALHMRSTRMENTEIPLARRDSEVLKRGIKRVENEIDLVGRNIGLTKKARARVSDSCSAYENTLRSQNTELVGIKKAVDELQKARGSLAVDESRDEERLRRILDLLQKKQTSLKSLENSNRQLETVVAEVEEKIAEQHNLCELAREGNNLETKTLVGLRSSVHATKTELMALMSQMKRIKDDISRADDLVFSEHSHHHHIDSESACISADVQAFHDKSAKLEQKRVLNEAKIVRLGHELDETYVQKEHLRKKYRHIMGEKDIVGARLVSTDAEHRRTKEVIETNETMSEACDRQYHKSESDLEDKKAETRVLLEKKKNLHFLLEQQRELNGVLSALEHDLSKQLDKNSSLVVEIGRPINLHRWRYLRDKEPNTFMMLEKIQSLQRQAIATTDKVTMQEGLLEKKKRRLSTLKKEVAGQESVDTLKIQFLALKSEFHHLSKETRSNKKELQTRIDRAEDLKGEIIKLEKHRMDIKAEWLVARALRS